MANPRGTPENLRPFPKGTSGNPGGGRKDLSLTRLVRNELQKPAVPGSPITKGQMVAEKIVSLAQAGHTVFAPLVWRYVDGDPKVASELSLRELAEQLAEKMGLDAAELLAAFERDMGAG